MSDTFADFKLAVQKQFDTMKRGELFRSSVGKDTMWEGYLSSFPEGSNPIFRERTVHDCQCCRQFIRSIGNMVSIEGTKLISVWDIEIGGDYQVVADTLSALAKGSKIKDFFLYTDVNAGVNKNNHQLEDGTIETWEHFFIKLPKKFVKPGADIATILGGKRSTRNVFHRGLKEITIDALDTVLELISNKSLYRGEEHEFAVNEFRKHKRKFDGVPNDLARDIYCWSNLSTPVSVSKIRSSAIGTLLIDLSEGKDLDYAVKSFEQKVAPTNYKRPTALITKGMIKKAQEEVEELGYTSALERRYAVAEDITINNVLYASRSSKKSMNVFDELAQDTSENIKHLDKVEEVGIETFINDILPKADSLEVLFENSHARSLLSLIAPVDSESKNMFKWGNNFSWAYAGELTDSIKERVKQAGGNVEGDLRCSLSWYNHDDLDLHMKEPGPRGGANGYHIYYGDKLSYNTQGRLDVDMNAGNLTRTPVENITYPDRTIMYEGTYKLYVNNFHKRESSNVGFEVEVEFDGVINTFGYEKTVGHHTNVAVASIKYTKKDGFKILESLPSSQTSKIVWEMPTQSFQEVSMLMYSPNHWDDKTVGNKHYFFMLKNCLNEGKARGFFNEFLIEKLSTHRKVFEVLGSKMKTEESVNQLSGIGFSSTQRNHLFCKVTGSFARTIKILF